METTRTTPLRQICTRLGELFDSGFAAMAQYPYDLNEMPWPPDFAAEDLAASNNRRGGQAQQAATGRTIKVVPPPASQRYHAEKARRIPLRIARLKQSRRAK